jgi:MFS family permease
MQVFTDKLRGKLSIFSNRQFLKLWGNQILLQTAFNVANFTGLLMIDVTTGSRFALAQFYAAMTLPAFLIGFFAGSIVDIYNRKRLIIMTNALLTILFLCYAFFGNHHFALLAIAFAAAAVSQFFTPAEAASLPLLVKEKDLEQANAIFLFTGMGAVMVGYALAGPLIQTFGGLPQGASAGFVFSAILTLIGFALTSTLKNIGGGKDELDEKIFERAIHLTQEVIAVTRNNYRILVPIALLTLIEFNVGMMAILFIDYVKVYLAVPATSTSYFLVVPLILGLGIGIELLILTKKRWGRALTIYYGTLIFGLVLFALGLGGILLTQHYFNIGVLRLITIICAGLSGVSVVFIAVNARTILQENTPKTMLGRVFSLVTVSASAVTPIPVLLVALLTEKIDVTTVFVGFGLLLFFASIIARPILTRRIRVKI